MKKLSIALLLLALATASCTDHLGELEDQVVISSPKGTEGGGDPSGSCGSQECQ